MSKIITTHMVGGTKYRVQGTGYRVQGTGYCAPKDTQKYVQVEFDDGFRWQVKMTLTGLWAPP